jgi:hypothetical protein
MDETNAYKILIGKPLWNRSYEGINATVILKWIFEVMET